LILTDTIWEVVETIGTLATVTTAIVDTAFTLTVVYITEIILGSCHLTLTSCEMNKSFVKQHHHFYWQSSKYIISLCIIPAKAEQLIKYVT